MQQMQQSGEQTVAPVETAEEKKTLVTEEILPDEQAKDRTEETKAPEDSAPPAPVTVKTQGVILVWGNSVTIRQDDGSKLELDPTNATISSGYFPEEGDTVQIQYDLDSMALQDIQLISRPD